MITAPVMALFSCEPSVLPWSSHDVTISHAPSIRAVASERVPAACRLTNRRRLGHSPGGATLMLIPRDELSHRHDLVERPAGYDQQHRGRGE